MPNLFLLGDSTCAIKEGSARPETGWGEMFQPYLNDSWTLKNLAKNGCSTEMILREGIFIDCYFAAGEGDYVIIQFGHNESKPEEYRHTEPWSTYQDNLRYIIKYLEKKGAKAVLISSIARRNFVNGHMQDTHNDYPKAMEAVAKEHNLPFIEMSQRTLEYFDKAGEEESLKYFMNFQKGLYPNFPEGKSDNTHLRPEGAALIAHMIAAECSREHLPFVKEDIVF